MLRKWNPKEGVERRKSILLAKKVQRLQVMLGSTRGYIFFYKPS